VFRTVGICSNTGLTCSSSDDELGVGDVVIRQPVRRLTSTRLNPLQWLTELAVDAHSEGQAVLIGAAYAALLVIVT